MSQVPIGSQIEKESFRIIQSELGETIFSTEELSIVTRVIHATGDFDYARNLRFSPNAIQQGIAALRRGAPIFTDVNMVRVGISRAYLPNAQTEVHCLVDIPETRAKAEREGITRSSAGLTLAGNALNGAILAIGNAPTALLEILRLIKEAGVQPALVIGAPVGFVNAVESKDALFHSECNWITTLGRKGGSPVAAAMVNAIAKLATSQGKSSC